MYSARRVCVWVMIISLCVVVSGCLIQHRSYTNQTSAGRELSKSQVKKIKPGETTKEWLLETFGTPTRQRTYDEGDETWEYERSYRTEHEFKILILFETQNTRRSRETLIIDIKSGIVHNYWFE